MLRLRSLLRVLVLTTLATVATVATVAGTAHAQEECPLGSTPKSDKGQTWCEPTVCDQDTQCPTGSVCRPVPLCVEIGTLDTSPGAKADGGERLLVRQRCGADKSCPQRTTCSDKGRCITRAQAERAGLTASDAGAGAGAGAGAAGAPAAKKGCGCSVPGTSGGELGGAGLALLGALAVAARRRSRAPASSR